MKTLRHLWESWMQTTWMKGKSCEEWVLLIKEEESKQFLSIDSQEKAQLWAAWHPKWDRYPWQEGCVQASWGSSCRARQGADTSRWWEGLWWHTEASVTFGDRHRPVAPSPDATQAALFYLTRVPQKHNLSIWQSMRIPVCSWVVKGSFECKGTKPNACNPSAGAHEGHFPDTPIIASDASGFTDKRQCAKRFGYTAKSFWTVEINVLKNTFLKV